jgi:hypothetical protein
MAADNIQQDASQFTKIYTLSLPAGIKRDGTIFETNEYSDGVWCRFQRGQPKKMGGYRQVFNTHVGIYRGMIVQPHNGVNYLFAGNYEEIDVFTTNTNYALGAGPFKANILLGTVFATVKSNTTTNIIVDGDVTTVFPAGTEVLFEQSSNPTIYEVDTITYNSGTQETTVVLTSAMPAGTVTRMWVAEPPFTQDPENGPYTHLWQFDASFNQQDDDLNILAHPGKNLINIDNGIPTQVLIGNITPDDNNQWNFVGLSDSEGQNPTYQPISVDGGVCMLYPFIFVYGSHGFIANNNVDSTAADRTLFDWNGPLANQVNVAASKIVHGMPMRGGTNSPSGLFWSTDSLIRVSFNPQATSNYWTYDIVSSQISIMSSNAIVEMDGTFFWMGVDRFYLYNGQVAVLPNDKNVNWLFDNINYQQRQKVWATKIPRYNEIWFFYPRGTATECTDAIIFNVKDKLWYDAGSAVGARRSCGYTTEILPTPMWAGWEYQPVYSRPYTIIEHPASLPAPLTNQFYLSGNQTSAIPTGSWVTAQQSADWNTVYRVASSEFTINTTIGMPGVTLITMEDYNGSALQPGEFIYNVTEGYSIWQHEFGQNAVTTNATYAVKSSITTSDISWITGNPGGDSLIGLNRRMHLRRVEPNFLQTGEMSMTVLGRKFANGAAYIENSGPFYFSPQDGKIDMRVEHRLVRLKFESNTVDGNFEMGRLIITAEFGDERP